MLFWRFCEMKEMLKEINLNNLDFFNRMQLESNFLRYSTNSPRSKITLKKINKIKTTNPDIYINIRENLKLIQNCTAVQFPAQSGEQPCYKAS